MRCGSSCSYRRGTQQLMQPCCGSKAEQRGVWQHLAQAAETAAAEMGSSSGSGGCQAARAGMPGPRANTRCSGVTTLMMTLRRRCVSRGHVMGRSLFQLALEAAVPRQQATWACAVQRCSCSGAILRVVWLSCVQEPEPQPTVKAKKKRVAAPLDVSPLPRPSAISKKAVKLVQF